MTTTKRKSEKASRKTKQQAGLVEDTFDKGTEAVHDIHRSISDLPFDVLHRLGVMDQTISEVKRIHDTSVDAIYDTIRDVNRKVAKFSDDLFEEEAARPKKETIKQTTAA